MIDRIHALVCKFSSFLIPSPLLLLLRLHWGYLFFQSGLHKFHDMPATIQFFKEIHIFMPAANAYFVAFIETVGGLMLMAGLYSRLAALPLTAILITAYFTAHYSALTHLLSDPIEVVHQAPWNFLITTLLVLGFGPGFFSIDALLNSKNSNPY